MKRKLILVAVVAVLAIVMIVASQLKSSLRIKISEKNATNVQVLVNGKNIDPVGKGGSEYVAKVNFGKATIVVESSDYKRVETEESVGFLGSKEVSIVMEKKDALGLASEFVSSVKGNVQKEKVFEDKWLAFLLTPESSDADTIIVVAKKSDNGTWEIIEEGTSVEVSSTLNPPDELINYIKSL